jgi:riboflavin synthase
MFTGLVETTGEVIAFTPTAGAARLTIAAPGIVERLHLGDSVAVCGVCLTALTIEPDAFPPRFSADLAAETIARTTLSRLVPGSLVNLELPTAAGSPLGGHLVQGHVDGTGTLISIEPVAAGTQPDLVQSGWTSPVAPQPDASQAGAGLTDWVVRVRLPQELMRYVVLKGSIAVEGISLTVAGIEGAEIWIAILPHTYSATNLHTLTPGMAVNIEVDVMAKYAESRAQADASKRELTVESLLANGF